MPNVDKIFYSAMDGLQLCGILAVPPNVKGWVVMAHGITQNKDEWNGLYKDIAQKLYQENFASLRFDFIAPSASFLFSMMILFLFL